jgi:hypothetical protein
MLTIDYIASRYGHVLVQGGPGRIVALALRLVRKLARCAGADVEDVLVAVRERYWDRDGGQPPVN